MALAKKQEVATAPLNVRKTHAETERLLDATDNLGRISVGILKEESKMTRRSCSFVFAVVLAASSVSIASTDAFAWVRAGGYHAGGFHGGYHAGGAYGYHGGAYGYHGGAYGYHGGAYGYHGGGYGYGVGAAAVGLGVGAAIGAAATHCGYYPYGPC